MGVSAQAHRAVTGCFAAKFCSPGWRLKSSAKKKKKYKWGKSQRADDSASVTPCLERKEDQILYCTEARISST